MITNNQIFVVVDIEADGPAVGLNSMISLAAVATTPEQEMARFYRKLQTLEGAKPDPVTTEWWNQNTEAWIEANTDPQPPDQVMIDFYNWVTRLEAEPIFVSSPIGFDYAFVSWYLFRFAPSNPFRNRTGGIRTIDIRSYIAGVYGVSFDDSSRLKWPASLTKNMPAHTHKAIDDAAGYAFLLRKLIKSRPPPQL